MKTARLFINGRSQAVRLPKECRFTGTDVYIKKIQDLVVLFPMNDPWASFIRGLERFSEDFSDTASKNK
jgi:antitoxin VapB